MLFLVLADSNNIYNVLAEKFVLNDGTLSGTAADAVNIVYSGTVNNPCQFKFVDGGCINISGGKLQVMSYDTPDDGNCFSVLPQFSQSLSSVKEHLEKIFSFEPWKERFLAANTIASDKLGKIGYPTSEAYTIFQATINALTENQDYTTLAEEAKGAMWGTVVYPSTGFYYLHNTGTGTERYAFCDENYDELTERDLLNNEKTVKHIWRVTANEGSHSINVKSLRGKNISTDNGRYESLDLATAYENNFTNGYGTFYMGCLQDPQQERFTITGGSYDSSTNPMTIAHWDGDRTAAKAYWQFEEVDMESYDVYDVVVTGAYDDKSVTYNGSETEGNKTVWNNGWYFFTKDAVISINDFTPEEIANTKATVTIEDNTITVTYTIVDYAATVKAYLTENKIANVNNAGQYGYPKTTTDSYRNLKPLVDKLDDTNAEWTAMDYENVITYYEAYLAETDIVVPEAGKFYRLYVVTNSGAKKYVTAKEGKVVGTTEQINESESIWYYNENKLTVFANGYQYAATAAANHITRLDGTSVSFKKSGTGNLGVLNVKPNGNNEWYVDRSSDSESGLNAWGGGENVNCDIMVEDVTALPITISEAGLATFYSPVAVTVPENVTAYTGEISEDGAALNLTSVKEIPANTAVILEGEGEVSLPIAGAASAETGNEVFTGTISTIATPEGTQILTLQNRDGKTGFYPYEGDTLAGFKAYLKMTTSGPAGVKGIDLNFGMTDAIREIAKDGQQAGAVYDLTGRRVEKAVKGIYIVNGKKTVIK